MIQLTHAGVRFPPRNTLIRLRDTILKNARIQEAPALDDITLWIGKGESFALIGGRGSGKTTLLRLIAKDIQPDTGSISVHGRLASAISRRDGLYEDETGVSSARLKLFGFGVPINEINARIDQAARLFNDDTLFKRRVGNYSEPERDRLASCIALAAKPDILVISGALDSLDMPYKQQYAIEIRRMLREGMSLLIESNDEELLSRLCESALWLRAGKLYRLGSFEELYSLKRFYSKKNIASGLGRVAFSASLMPKIARIRRERGSFGGIFSRTRRR